MMILPPPQAARFVPMAGTRAKKLRYWLEWLGVTAGMAIVPLFPRSLCYALGRACGMLGYLFDTNGRRVALANIEAAFGPDLTDSERRTVACQSYQTFATTLIDLFWSSRLTQENYRRYVEIEGIEPAEREPDQDRFGIAVSIHYGNFEWLPLVLGFLGYSADIVAERAKNPLLNPPMNQVRSRSGIGIVPRERAIVRLFKKLRRGRRAAILIDLNVRPTQPAVVINCFGMETCVTLAHAWLHQRTGTAILPAHSEHLGGGRYRVICHPKVHSSQDATATEIAQRCWDSFETLIRKNPGAWLWMYKHWRFQPKDAARKYPFYANISPHFEKLKKRLHEAELAGSTGR